MIQMIFLVLRQHWLNATCLQTDSADRINSEGNMRFHSVFWIFFVSGSVYAQKAQVEIGNCSLSSAEIPSSFYSDVDFTVATIASPYQTVFLHSNYFVDLVCFFLALISRIQPDWPSRRLWPLLNLSRFYRVCVMFQMPGAKFNSLFTILTS